MVSPDDAALLCCPPLINIGAHCLDSRGAGTGSSHVVKVAMRRWVDARECECGQPQAMHPEVV